MSEIVNATLSSNLFFGIVDILKNFTDNVTLQFCNSTDGQTSGMKICELNEKQTVIIYLKLSPEEFTNFHVNDGRHRICINLKSLYSYYKFINFNDGNTTLSFDSSDKNYLKLDIDSKLDKGDTDT